MNTILTDSPETADSLDPHREVDLLQDIIAKLQPLGAGARGRILEAAATFLGVQQPAATGLARSYSNLQGTSSESHRPSFSADLSMSPKEFMLEKQPMTDVERVACLAYY